MSETDDSAFVAYYHPTSEMVLCRTLHDRENKQPIVWLVREHELDQAQGTLAWARRRFVYDKETTD
ncbi:MAG: hypothetical protein M3394_03380 [Actinomycetota bacterium]|nr:hypothetical protein [Actinomycetota bacterium]